MSDSQDNLDNQPSGDATIAASDTAKSTAGTNIVLYTPKTHTDGVDSKPTAPRVTSKWATRRVSRIVAIAAIAAAVGAISGSLATLGVSHILQSNTTAADQTGALRQTIARLETEFGALKTNTERATKTAAGQLSQTSDRMDKLAKAQDDASAKLTKISDGQEKMRAAAAAPAPAGNAPAASANSDITGSITAGPPKSDARIVAATPVLDGWTLAKVSRGGAVVAGRSGFYEVYPGDPLPGAGRVEAVRYQDGRWVVITQKGLIIRR